MADPQTIARLYAEHINPGLVRLMHFAGVDQMEVRAEGVYVYDGEGNAYLDFLAGFGALNFGHRHPQIVKAVEDQLSRQPLSSRVLFNEVTARLAHRLSQITPGNLKYCFFCHSGAEAVEACLKLARLSTGRKKIVSMNGGYHGKTLGALSASGRHLYRAPFEPLLDWFTFVPFGDCSALEEAVTEETAAVLVEPIQGEGGIIVPPDDFLPFARKVCDRVGALLIVDEVQTGLGRTGRNFAIEHWGVAPDLMPLAKSLGGGVLPLGAAVGTEEAFRPLFDKPLLHSSTLGGNPLACAAGLAALEVLESERLAERTFHLGNLLIHGLNNLKNRFPDFIADVRGKGLLVGIEFADEDGAALTATMLIKRRILTAYTLNNPKVIRLQPPLIVEEHHISEVLSAFEDALAEVRSLIAQLA
ncbi:MAG: aminotransferase class III-fold pyridoxal phosphate-dependent enzyme [Armatimonadetes bacterium]|nr:aminotransferase class III-fold pyridoxal phosphate-dependent enzyme [Armatimonadota bacterium]MDW8121432.1 aminotransferase class III-fold pyridoxal phosphate-dependent enzyme [Armatimonadota bacterium]